jgi:hypothetical protein
VGLERGPLSLVSTTDELLDKKSSGSCLENREYGLGIRHVDHVASFIRKSWQPLRREAAVARYSSLADSDHGAFFVLLYSLLNLLRLIFPLSKAQTAETLLILTSTPDY